LKGSEPSPGRQSNEKFQAVFFARYDELVADILQTEYQFVRNKVKLWFDFLDSTAITAAPILVELEERVDFRIWFEPYYVAGIGGGTVEWPDAQTDRLGAQLHLLRQFANGDVKPVILARTILLRQGNTKDAIAEIIYQIFLPMCIELAQYLKRHCRQ
jgi:hypothetical protein